MPLATHRPKNLRRSKTLGGWKVTYKFRNGFPEGEKGEVFHLGKDWPEWGLKRGDLLFFTSGGWLVIIPSGKTFREAQDLFASLT